MLKEDKRNYGIDLLRIVSMLMVCMLHILGQGGLVEIGGSPTSVVPGTGQYEIAQMLKAMTFGAVNCYALISGYVGIYSNTKWKNIVRLWLQVAFYSVLLTFPFRVFAIGDIGRYRLLVAIRPVTKVIYWYFTAYFCLLFFIPFLNKLVCSLDGKELIKLVLLILCFFSAARILNDQMPSDQMPYDRVFYTNDGYSVWWLTLLYILGGCMRRLQWTQKCPQWLCVIVYLVGAFIVRMNEEKMLSYTALPILLGSMALLILFSQLQPGRILRKVISKLAPLTFGVYLIHTHPLVFEYGMKNRFVPLGDLQPVWFVVGLLACTLGLFAVCALIEAVRKLAFRWLGIDWLCDKIGQLLLYIEDKLFGTPSVKC